MIFESGELISDWQYLPTIDPKAILESAPRQPAVTALAGFSGGLIVGLDNGSILYYEKTEEHPYFKKKKEELIEESEVSHIAWNVREDRAVITLKSNQIYLFQIETDQKGEHIKYDRLSHSFHSGPIMSLDVCISKPLIATSGHDKSIRIWNYMENTLEIANFYPETATCMTIHPNGLYILAGFPAGLRLMAILLDEIKTLWEYNIRSARGCKFSHGGQYFAVITAINVTIFSTWSLETIGVLKVNSGRIKCVLWSDDDTQLLTYCTDGSVQQWDGFTFSKNHEISLSNEDGDVVGAALNPSASVSFVLSSEGSIKEVVGGSLNRQVNTKVSFTDCAALGQMLFTAQRTGQIRAHKFPFDDDGPLFEESTEYGFSSSSIAHLQIAPNGRFLFTAGMDGTVWIHKILDKDGRILRREKDWELSDEILVQKSDLRQNYKYLAGLKTKVEEIKMQGEEEIVQKDIQQQNRLNEVSLQHLKDMSAVQTIIDRLNEERVEVRAKNVSEIEKIRTLNLAELEELKESFFAKLEIEENRFGILLDRKLIMESQWQNKMKDIEQSHKDTTVEISSFFSKQMEENNNFIAKLKKESLLAQSRNEVQMLDIDKDIEQEALEIAYLYESKLKEEKSMFASVEEENRTMKSTFVQLQLQIEQHKKELANSAGDSKKLTAFIKSLENDIVGLKNEVKERDDTITDKEKRVYDLRKKNQELEKFRYVLDFKIIELKKQEEPREKDMQNLHRTFKVCN